MVAYTLVNGICTSARFVPPGYVAQPGELLANTDVLSLDALSDPAALAAKQAAAAAAAARLGGFDAAIAGDPNLQQFKAMDKAAFDAWWAANVTTAAQAIVVLRKLTWLLIRYVLQ